MLGLGLALSLAATGYGAGGPAPADFIVTTDAEFATANTAATAGQIIELADIGTFTALTLTNATGITVRGETYRVPTVRSLTINGAQNATVTGLKVQANAVPSGAPKLVDLLGNCNGVVIEDCLIRGGNPWGGYANFDPTVTDGPRMGSSVDGWSATNPYASDLWYGIGSSGSGATLPYGSITIRNNTITDLGGGVKFGNGTGGTMALKINGNVIGRCYQDIISIIIGATSLPITALEVCGNELFDSFAQAQDNANPHSDAIQIGVVGASSYSFAGWLIAGNIMWFSPGGRGGAQRLFTDGYDAGHPVIAPIIVDNILLSRMSSHGITLVGSSEGAAWAYVRRNLIFARPTENAAMQNELQTNTTSGVGPSSAMAAALRIANSPTLSDVPNYIAYNVTESLGSYASDRLVGNITTTGPATTAAAYATWLDTDTAPEWAAIVNADTALAALNLKSAYAANNPIQTGDTAAAFRSRWSVDGNRPWASMPSWVDWNDLSNVTPSSTQTSEWAFVHAGNSSRSISISGGEYRVADDYSGTNATAWGSSSGTIAHGKFLQVRQTASGSGSTATTVTVTIGSESADWSVTTASNTAFPIVLIDATTRDLFKLAGASTLGANGYTGTAAIMRFKAASNPTATTEIFGQSAGSGYVQVNLLTTGRIRLQLRDSAGTVIGQLDAGASSLCDNAYHDILISWDTSDSTAATGWSAFVDGASSRGAGAWTPAGAQVNYSGSINAYQFGPRVGDRDFEVGAFYLNSAARVDITNATNRAKFNADQIGSDGSGPTGAQPIHFLVGTAGQSGGWNDAAGINRGSGGKFIKVGSAAAVDVSGSAWA